MDGLDFAWSKPSPAAIKSNGYGFVCRYLSYDKTGKNLTYAEAQSYIPFDIKIVSNWEYNPRAALNGFTQGVADATEGSIQHLTAGGPSAAPIYFSVDFDATEADQVAIDAYFDGVASVIGLARTGAYGGYYVIQRLFNANKITWGWQTYGWSGGQWDSRAQLRQVHNGIIVGGADCDRDISTVDYFGGWLPTPTGVTTPGPIPPSPPVVHLAPGPALEYPLPAGYYFGPASGPVQSVSGLYHRVFSGHPDWWWLCAWADQLWRRGWPVGANRRWLPSGNDGHYGPEYHALAVAFQQDQGLTPDGLIGPATWWAAYHNPVT